MKNDKKKRNKVMIGMMKRDEMKLK